MGAIVTAYSLAIAHHLTAQLTRMANLPPQLLVGHAAQVEFWTEEVEHCLHVLDTYEQRFRAMLAAQQQVESDIDPLFYRPVPRPGHVPEPHRHHVRSELCRAFANFVVACRHRTSAPIAVLRDQCARLGITVVELEA